MGTWIGLIIVVSVIVGSINYLQTGNPLKFSVAGTAQTTTSSFSGSCPAVQAAGYPKIQYQAFVVNTTTGVPFQVNTVANVLYAGAVVQSTNTIGTQFQWLNATVPCGAPFSILIGDNKFVNAGLSSIVKAGGNITTVKVYNLSYAAAPSSITYSNGVVFGQATTTAGPVGAASSTYTFTETIIGGAGNYGSNAGALISCGSNVVAIQSCTASGQSLNGQPLTLNNNYQWPTTANVPNTNYQKTSYVLGGGIQQGKTYVINWQVRTSAAFAANTVILTYKNDLVNFLANGNSSVQAINPLSYADIGQTLINNGNNLEPTGQAFLTSNIIAPWAIRFN
jgi:hypothetical protein